MTKSKNTKRALLASVLSMILCLAMLVGSTFAWFTDSVTSGKNRIVAGNLDVELYYKNASTNDWADASEASVAEPKFFVDKNGEAILWEPGVMAVTQFKVANVGSLALKYSLATLKADFNAMAGHDLSEVIKFAVIDNDAYAAATAREDILALNPKFTDFTGFTAEGHLLPEDKVTTDEPSEETFTVVAYWAPGADDNLYNVNNGQKTDDNADQLYINIEIRLNAAQYTYEKDSFDENYDENAEYPKVESVSTKWFDEAAEDATTYELSTAADLAGLAQLVNAGESFTNKTIALKNNIVLDKTSNWIPIGTMDNKFTGTFDGNGKTVSNLMFDQSMATDAVFAGLFGVVDGATIKNLTVEGNITAHTNTAGASYSCGGICAIAYGTSIFENCTSNVNIDGTKMGNDSEGMLAAGIVGAIPGYEGAKVTFIDCVNNGNITVGNENSFGCVAAGITAMNFNSNAVINEVCKNNGTVIAYGEDCAYGDVTANEMLGI